MTHCAIVNWSYVTSAWRSKPNIEFLVLRHLNWWKKNKKQNKKVLQPE